MAVKRIAILGAGGQAREIAWLIRDINRQDNKYQFLGYIVRDTAKLGGTDTRDNLLGNDSWLDENSRNIDCLAIGIGDPRLRLKLGRALTHRFPSIEWPTLMHPSAVLDSESCKVGPGVVISAGVVCTTDISIGAFSLINFGSTIGHDVQVGEGCVVNPGASISGGVVLDDGVLVGTGAQILQYLAIGSGATVGAGAVVVKNVAEKCTVVGIPARLLERH